MSDDLIAEIRRNPAGETAWKIWYEAAYPQVYYVAHRLASGNTDAARDLTQEAFTRFLRYGAIERVASDAHAVAYLIETCRNIAATRYERLEKTPVKDMERLLATATAEQQNDLQLMLRQLLPRLKPGDRQLLKWAMEGLPLSRIAKRLDITYSAAGVRLHRLKKQIRGMLDM